MSTQKKRSKSSNRTRKNRNELWRAFDESIGPPLSVKFTSESLSNYEAKLDTARNTDPRTIVPEPAIDGSKCTVCDGIVMVDNNGVVLCTNSECGIISKKRIDFSPEWRWYSSDDSHGSDPTRCGLPTNPLLQESSFGCSVAIRSGMPYEMRKIKRYTDWQAMPYKEKARYEEFQTIIIHASLAGIPKMIIEDAMYLHKQISEYKTFRGDNRDGIIAASIYLSCKQNHFPRTAREIAAIFRLEVKNATRGCKNAMAIMNDNTHSSGVLNSMHTSHEVSPVTFIERFCSRLQISAELTMLAKFIALKVQCKNDIPENTPHSIAVGIIYLIVNVFSLEITKRTVAAITEISEVTINKCFKKLYAMKDELIPDVIMKKYNIDK